MSYGIEIYRNDGKMQLSTARITRVHSQYRFNTYDTFKGIPPEYANTDPSWFGFRTYTLSIPGIRDDGKWLVVASAEWIPTQNIPELPTSLNNDYYRIDYYDDYIIIWFMVAGYMGTSTQPYHFTNITVILV